MLRMLLLTVYALRSRVPRYDSGWRPGFTLQSYFEKFSLFPSEICM